MRVVGRLLLVALLGAGACLQRTVPGPDVPGAEPGAQLPRPSLKRVAQKIPSNRLVAEDDTWCTVDARTFEETTIGQRVLCIWRSGSADVPAR